MNTSSARDKSAARQIARMPDASASVPITPQYRSLVGVDIEGSTTRTNVERACMRRVMYELVELAFHSSSISNSQHDPFIDRGDGILIPVHPVREVPKTLLLTTVIPNLSRLLAQHNAEHAGDRPLRMRAVIHAGEVHYDDHNCFGEAIDLACRLLDAPEFKRQLHATDAPLVLIVSDDIYTSIVRQGYAGINADDFHPLVRVQMAGQRHRGWVAVPSANQVEGDAVGLELEHSQSPAVTPLPEITGDPVVDAMIHHAGQEIDRRFVARADTPEAIVDRVLRKAATTGDGQDTDHP